MSVIITGADGMLGSAVVRALHEAGYDVVPHHGRADGDLTQRDAVERLFSIGRYADTVIHCAADIGGVLSQTRRDYFADNVAMGTRLIETASRVGVKRFIFISSSTVYPGGETPATEVTETRPDLAYASIGQVKLFLERFGRTRPFEKGFVVLRPSAIYGPHDRGFRDVLYGHVIPGLIDRVRQGRLGRDQDERFLSVWGSLDVERDFIYVEDVARAVLCAIEDYRWNTVNVCAGESVTIGHLARVVLDACGKASVGLRATKSEYASGTKIRRVSNALASQLGWAPRVSLTAGIRRTVTWLRGDKT